MTIPQDIKARLTAALPAGTPVLLPEEIEKPREGRRPGQTGGLTAYLAAHPGGYVQIEESLPITSDGTTAVFWVAVVSWGPDAAACDALAGRVHRALNGEPWEPGPHPEVAGDTVHRTADGAWYCRPTYAAYTINRAHVGAQE